MSYTRRAINLGGAELRACAASPRFRFFSRDPDPWSGALPIVAVSRIDRITWTAEGVGRIDPAAADLVWGHGIVDATWTDDTIPVLAVVGASPSELVQIAVRREGRSGGYGWEEQDRIAEYCRQNGVAPDAVRDLVDPGGDFMHHLERYRALAPEVRRWVDRGICDLRTAERIAGLPPDLMPAIERAGEGLSFSNRRRFLVMARDVLQRDGEAPVREILEAGENAAERLERLRRVRYPELSALETTLERVNREHLRGTGVRVEVPKNFEGGALTVSFPFSSTRELERRLRSADRIREKSDELLGLLFGNDR